jgi:hypothetical protein
MGQLFPGIIIDPAKEAINAILGVLMKIGVPAHDDRHAQAPSDVPGKLAHITRARNVHKFDVQPACFRENQPGVAQ